MSQTLIEVFNLSGVIETITGSSQEEEVDTRTYLEPYIDQFRFSESDIKSLLIDDDAFRTLQRSLRERNCATNLYLEQTMHCYIKHVKEIRKRNAIRLQHANTA